MFLTDEHDLIDVAALRPAFDAQISDIFGAATLTRPNTDFTHKGGKTGKRHTEHLGHMLAAMQFLPRAYPDAKW
jgi:ring-1,2-phenylacetyl-CoA epoxidase subunit PaaC